MVALNKNTTDGTDKFVTTYYVREPQGNVLAVYEKKEDAAGAGQFQLKERHLYGMNRLGMVSQNVTLAQFDNSNVTNGTDPTTPQAGDTHYELTNHLGNVMAVISDTTSATAEPTVVSLSDYYPFGMTEPGRSYRASDYRYGFNGKEIVFDDSQDYGERIYKPNIARFLSADPLIIFNQEYPELSPYQFASNTPIWAIDLDGLEKLALTGFNSNKNEGASYLNKDGTLAEFTETIRIQANNLEKNYGFRHAIVNTGKKLLEELEKESMNGPIKFLVIFAHGEPDKICLNNNEGFFTLLATVAICNEELFDKSLDEIREALPNYKADCVEVGLKKMIEEGKIKFSEDAIIFIDACYTGSINNSASMAQNLADVTGATVIATNGAASMKNKDKNGEWIADGQFTTDDLFYEFKKGEAPKALENSIDLTKIINNNEKGK